MNNFSILILLMTLFSVAQWSKLPLGNTYLSWTIDSLIIIHIIRFINKTRNNSIGINDKIVKLYLFWLILCIVRGVFVADNYWEWKQLVGGSFALLLPIYIYYFSYPSNISVLMRFWLKYAMILFVLIFSWNLSISVYHFYLGPILLLLCLFPLLTKKWKLISALCAIIMITGDWGARSQVIKAVMGSSLGILLYYHNYISTKALKILHWGIYIISLILLVLGVSGVFNVFEDFASSKSGKYVESRVVNGEIVEEDLSSDTRSFIYIEVLESAIRNNYLIWGRTPARGNDSMAFGALSAEELKTGKYERHSNELCHLNILTWTGLIGLLLYSLIYLQSSWLAVYRSRNVYMKILGCFIAFRWAYGWIEDFNRFDIMNLSLWIIISMGFSSFLRNMNDYEFSCFVKSMLPR